MYSTFNFHLFLLDKNCHLSTLIEALKPTVDWINLGIHLGVSHAELKAIEREQMGRVVDCKREMLVKWLDGSDDPTKQELINALGKITCP